jgi:hypothetical protein
MDAYFQPSLPLGRTFVSKARTDHSTFDSFEALSIFQKLVNSDRGSSPALTWQCLRLVIGRYETDSGNLDLSSGCFLVAG